MKKKALFFLLVVLPCSQVFSQIKFEKEYRVAVHKVPQKALSFINKSNFNKKVKWYSEESQDGQTFEAKINSNKGKLSIEFSKEGDLIDVEKTIKFSKLLAHEQELINSIFNDRFLKYRIRKVQYHYEGSMNSMIETIQKNTSSGYSFEIVVKGKKDNLYMLYEFLINQKGEVLKELKFAPRNFDNLEF